MKLIHNQVHNKRVCSNKQHVVSKRMMILIWTNSTKSWVNSMVITSPDINLPQKDWCSKRRLPGNTKNSFLKIWPKTTNTVWPMWLTLKRHMLLNQKKERSITTWQRRILTSFMIRSCHRTSESIRCKKQERSKQLVTESYQQRKLSLRAKVLNWNLELQNVLLQRFLI